MWASLTGPGVQLVDAPPVGRELEPVSNGIIDLGEYLRRKESDGEPTATFALFGADGDRSRFALPLWRAIYLVSGERGGVVWRGPAGVDLHPLVVLDLVEEPPRIDFDWPEGLGDEDRAPAIVSNGHGGLAVFLGSERGKRWYLVIQGRGRGAPAPSGRSREDVMLLAGECAGLLFLRDIASAQVP